MTSRVPLTRRSTSFALAVVLLAAQAATVAHEIVVTHAICAEHGEVVEVGVDSESTRHAAPDRHDGSGLHASAAGDSEAAHEHCASFTLVRNAVALFAPASALVAPTRAPDVSPGADVVLVARVPVYRTAPKSDPPV